MPRRAKRHNPLRASIGRSWGINPSPHPARNSRVPYSVKPALLLVLAFLLPSWAAAQTTMEQEPNETIATANRVSLGDSLKGTVAFDGDIDTFVMDVPAGTHVFMQRTSNNVHFCVYEPDGATQLFCMRTVVETQFYDFPLVPAGRYVLRVFASHPDAGSTEMGPYGFHIGSRSFALGPGDPQRLFAKLGVQNQQIHMATGMEGDVFVAVFGEDSVIRFDKGGYRSTVLKGVQLSGGIAVDAFGNLLVSGPENNTTTIWSVTPSGERKRLAANLGRAWTRSDFKLAVGPDGDIWAGEVDTVWRLDPFGAIKEKIGIPLCGVYAIAVAPSGRGYFSSQTSGCGGIHLLSPTGRQTVVRDSIGELAFDRNGALYVGVWDDFPPPDHEREWGRVIVFDPTFTQVRRIAHVPTLQGMAFLRNPGGNMSSEIVVGQNATARILVLNGAASRAAGSGPKRIRPAQFTLRGAALGTTYDDTLKANDATGATWSTVGGQLPPGIALSSAGVLHGTPTATGSFTFTVRGENSDQIWMGEASISVGTVAVSVTAIVDALMGGTPLSAAAVGFLDQNGNKNGQLDVGDLRAYLRTQGQLTSPVKKPN